MFDILVLLVLGLSTAFAAVRGGLRELATLIALAIAAFLALLLVEPTVGALGKTGSFFTTVFVAVGFVGVFFLLFHLLAHFGIKRIPLEGAGALADRIGGGVFGFARGLVLVGLGFLAYGYYQGEERQPDSVKNAMTRPLAAGMANWFLSFTPEENYLETEEPQNEVSIDDDAASLGYQRTDRKELVEVITTVTTTDDTTTLEAALDATPAFEKVDADDPIAEILAEDINQ